MAVHGAVLAVKDDAAMAALSHCWGWRWKILKNLFALIQPVLASTFAFPLTVRRVEGGLELELPTSY